MIIYKVSREKQISQGDSNPNNSYDINCY